MRNSTYCLEIGQGVKSLRGSDRGFDCRLTVVRPSSDRRFRALKVLTVLLLVLTVGVGNVFGDELTVSDATTSKEQSPIYGYYCDEVALHNQILYPTSVLSSMSNMIGKNIKGIKFYSSTANSAWGDPEFNVGLVEVTANSLSGLNSTTPINVYSGVLKVESNQLVIEFENDYEYQGGNLLIDIKCTKKGNYQHVYFYGETSYDNILSYASCSNSSSQYFIPKTTFTYEAATPVEGPALNVKDGSKKIDTGYDYNFGLVPAGSTKSFILCNPGTENISLNIAGTNGFAVDPANVIISAGEEETLTITMPSASAAGTVTITSTAPEVDPFTINVSGTVKDPSKIWCNFSEGLPDGWTKGSYTINTSGAGAGTSGGGYAGETNYSTTRMYTPLLHIASGESIFLLVAGYGGTASWNSMDIQYSANGTTWTTAKSVTNIVKGSWTSVEVTGIPEGNYYIGFNGRYVYFTDIYGGSIPSMPKDITLESATTNSLTLSWTPAGSETAWVMQYSTDGSNWSGDVAANSNPFTLTGLNVSTKYYVRVKAVGSSDWSQVAEFSTSCGAVSSLPWTQNFNDVTTDLPTCWEAAGANTASIVAEPDYLTFTSKGIYFTGSGGTYTYVILPEFDAAWSTLQIAFNHQVESTSSSGKIELGYYKNSTFTSLQSFTATENKKWKSEDYPLAGIPADARLAFGYKPNSSGYTAGIDDIIISELPACPKPTGLGSSEVTASSAKITWTSDASAWKVEYSKNSDFSASTVKDATEKQYVLSDLEENTIYYVRVKAVCGGDESDPTAAISFTTNCADKTLSFGPEGFEGGALPACWSAASQWAIYSYSGSGHDSNTAMRFNASTGADLTLPAIALSDKAQFSFWRMSSYVSCSVYINDGTGETKLGDFAKNSSWKKDSIDLSGYKGRTVTLIIRGNYYGSGKYLYIDDVAVTYKKVDAPTNVAVVPANASATVTWESAEDGTWSLQYRQANQEPAASWIPVTGLTERTAPLTELTNDVTYEVQVKTICSANRESAWSASANFTPQACPTVQGATLSAKTYNSVTVGCTMSGTGAWDLQYKAGEGEWLSAGTEIAEATKVVAPLEVGTLYSFQVKPSCGSDWTPVAETYTPAYTAPASATASASSDIAASASWSAVVDASGYEYLVLASGEPDWSSATSTSETSVASLGTLAGGTNYTFYVRAVYPSGNSAATTANFTTSTVAPQNLENSAVTTTTATFTWEANGAATQYQWKTSKTGSEWSEPTTDLTATAESLEPGTGYTFYVRSYYAAGIYSSEISTAFTTSCATKSIGWSENFDAADALPACWESTNFGSGNNKWNIGNFYESKSAWNSARFYAYRNSSASSADLITPAFELNEPAMLKFYYLKSSANNVAQVLIRIAGEEDALLWTATTKSSWAAKPDSIDLTIYTGNTVQFIFRAYGSSDNTNRYFFLDDVSVVAIPCYKPAFAATNVTPTTVGATITCEADKWNLRYRTNGVGNWTIVSDLIAESYDITGCIPNTEYEVQVQAVCSATRKSAWTSSQTFTPSCVAPTGLAASAIKRDGATITWTGDAKNLQYKVDGAADWVNVAIDEAEKANPYMLSGLEGSTTYEVRVQAFCAVDVDEAWTDAVAFTTKCALKDAAELPLDITNFTAVPECWEVTFKGEYSNVAGGKICFYGTEEQMAVLPAYDIDLNKLSVTFTYSLSGTADFGYLDEPNGAFHAFASQPTSGVELNLAGEATGAKYIAIRYNGSSSMLISGVQVRKTPTCNKPTGVTAVPSVGSATISWTSDAEAWKLQYKTGTEAWTEVSVAEKPYEITGLTQGTNYKVRVQAACAGEELSDWSDEVDFTTSCSGIDAIPYYADFTETLSSCWIVSAQDETYYKPYANTSMNQLIMNGGKEGASNNVVVMPPFSADLTNAVLSFEYSCSTGANNAQLEVGYITDKANVATFNTVETLAKSSSWVEARIPATSFGGNYIAFRYAGGSSHGDLAIRNLRMINQLVLEDDVDNSATIAANNGQTLDIQIGRTITCTGYFNTICLPFSLPTLDGTPLEGAELWAFKYAKVENEELLFRIVEASSIEAGKPYFIQFAAGDPIENPLFKNVTISATAGQHIGDASVAQLCGILQPETFAPGDKTKLFLYNENALYWWTGDHESQLKSFRAYFYVNTTSGANYSPIRHGMIARIIKEEQTATGVDNVQGDNVQCIKMIENDQIVIIKNGVKYNVQGQVISK